MGRIKNGIPDKNMAANENKNISDEEIFAAIENAESTYTALCGLLEDRNTILSDMAFWNPAEMIGENPHPLDYSLYRDIITESAMESGTCFDRL